MRLIDADKVEQFDVYFPPRMKPSKTAVLFFEKGVQSMCDAINTAPTVDPDSLRPTAKWENSFYESRENGKFIVCTRCRHAFSKKGLWCRKYCPECGASMVNYDD